MKMQILAASILVIANVSDGSSCTSFGSGSFKQTNCDDGNSYTTYTFGNGNSMTDGSNTRTGSRWNSDTMNVGNTTFNSGRDSDGNYWNNTTRHNGNSNDTDYSGSRKRKSYGYGE